MTSGEPPSRNHSERLLSLDVLRGFDMFWIVFGEVFVWSMVDRPFLGWLIYPVPKKIFWRV